jgi:hypothetical protein
VLGFILGLSLLKVSDINLKSELNEFEPSDPEVENKKQEDFKRITRSQVKK